MSTMTIPVRDIPKLHGLAEIRPFSLDEYHRMIELGIVPEDSRYEFIEGYVVAKDRGRGPAMGHGMPHASSVSRLTTLLIQAFAGLSVVRPQLPITLPPRDGSSAGSEPEPDAVVAEGRPDRYLDHHPGPAEIRLLAEVADSSLKYDREEKGRLYASAAIPLYWTVNLVHRQLEIYTDPDPSAGRYRSTEVLAEDRSVVLSWPGLAPVTFPVRDLLP